MHPICIESVGRSRAHLHYTMPLRNRSKEQLAEELRGEIVESQTIEKKEFEAIERRLEHIVGQTILGSCLPMFGFAEQLHVHVHVQVSDDTWGAFHAALGNHPCNARYCRNNEDTEMETCFSSESPIEHAWADFSHPDEYSDFVDVQ